MCFTSIFSHCRYPTDESNSHVHLINKVVKVTVVIIWGILNYSPQIGIASKINVQRDTELLVVLDILNIK